ncbi:MAG: NAD(P)-dependent oxidoreductase [Mycolicibacterium hassiacum]
MSSTRPEGIERVGFIGLGVMGAPMAGHLLDAGFEVGVFNRSPEKMAPLVDRGARAASDARDAAAGADVVITMLPDSPDVEQVVLGDGGVLTAMPPGSLFIDCTTVRPATSRAVAAAAAQRGIGAVDAPVSGGEVGAIAGTLAVMAGGSAEDVQRARPVLDAFAGSVQHVGPAGAGQTVKAANQMLVAGNLALLAEAIVFLEAAGIDPSTGLSAIAGGLAGSRCLDVKSPNMIKRDFTPGFRSVLHRKDLRIAADCAAESGIALPVTALVSQLIAAVCARGGGDLDHGAVLTVIDALSPTTGVGT